MRTADLLRWTGCTAVALAAHGLIALAIARRSDDVDLEAGAPVVMIELAPMAAAPPTPLSELAPGPQVTEAESEARPAKMAPRPRVMEAANEVKPTEEVRPEERQADEKRDIPDMPAPDPEVALPPPVPQAAWKPEETKTELEPREAAPIPTALPSVAVVAEQAAAPVAAQAERPSSQTIISWQRQLVAHLERHKRYPPRAHGEQGVASVAFIVDREGRVSGIRIVRSSGSAALDDETLAMIRRAQPLPVPPDGILDAELSFIVPVRYAASR
ncbi:MAG TPA: energy transducer TonB [Xanthobacteraceae bacterium]|nr:energy transducer TonB [Xanthobacteraceae bacterium]